MDAFKQQLQKACDSAEFEPITIKEAMSRKPKTDFICMSTPVKWGTQKTKLATQTINFKTIGKVNVITPPSLPRGYIMQPHPTWWEIYERIYNSENSYTLEQLDAIVVDLATLAHVTRYKTLSDIDYDKHDEWIDYNQSFHDAWDILREQIRELRETIAPQPEIPLHQGCMRIKPPSLMDTLNAMIAYVKEHGEPEINLWGE